MPSKTPCQWHWTRSSLLVSIGSSLSRSAILRRLRRKRIQIGKRSRRKRNVQRMNKSGRRTRRAARASLAGSLRRGFPLIVLKEGRKRLSERDSSELPVEHQLNRRGWDALYSIISKLVKKFRGFSGRQKYIWLFCMLWRFIWYPGNGGPHVKPYKAALETGGCI